MGRGEAGPLLAALHDLVPCRLGPQLGRRRIPAPRGPPLGKRRTSAPTLRAAYACAQHVRVDPDLDSSWDWGWYDPQLLEGFEKRIEEAYAPYRNLPPNFVELLVRMFVIQRSYVNEVAAAWGGMCLG